MSETTGSEGHVHRYHATCHWTGDTAVGYESYDRTHTSSVPPAPNELVVSADPAFLGNPQRLNPEQLVVVAASSCQLLSFLAIAARARVQVLEYDDHAEAVMPEEDKPMRLTRITLRPRIVVGSSVKEERVLGLTEMAHEQCYITNSLSTEVVVEPAPPFPASHLAATEDLPHNGGTLPERLGYARRTDEPERVPGKGARAGRDRGGFPSRSRLRWG
jgi:organic hydroperoxide reductase OsmC/OhrA